MVSISKSSLWSYHNHKFVCPYCSPIWWATITHQLFTAEGGKNLVFMVFNSAIQQKWSRGGWGGGQTQMASMKPRGLTYSNAMFKLRSQYACHNIISQSLVPVGLLFQHLTLCTCMSLSSCIWNITEMVGKTVTKHTCVFNPAGSGKAWCTRL